MISMNIKDFEVFLNSLTKSWCLSEKKHSSYLFLKIDPRYWPELTCKRIMINFLASCETKNHSFAKMMLAQEFKNLEICELPEIEDIKTILDFNIKKFAALELGSQLISNPDKADLLIKSFLSSSLKSNVELLNYNESLKTLNIDHLTALEKGEAMITIPNFEKLSDAIGGFNKGQLTLISALSGFGKTKFALNLCSSSSKKWPSLFFNMEMNANDFIAQELQRACEISNKAFRTGDYLTESNKLKILNLINSNNDNFKFTGGSAISIEDLISTIFMECSKYEFSICYIDYDQKILTSGRKEEWQEMLKVVSDLEEVAKKANCHIILLTQGNDDGDIKSSKRAKQPATSVLNLTKNENNNYYIKSIKNRKNKAFCLGIGMNHAISKAFEKDFINEQDTFRY